VLRTEREALQLRVEEAAKTQRERQLAADMYEHKLAMAEAQAAEASKAAAMRLEEARAQDASKVASVRVCSLPLVR
jgi:dihydroxyacetone kinase